MTGNIANPVTYKRYAEAGIHYVRVGIGSGDVCTTTDQTGMHYPMGTLLIKLKNEKTFLLPFIDNFIENVDIENKRIDVNLIEGMI